MTQSQPPSPLRIFIVENHPDTLESIIFYLESLGHEVFTAMNVQEGLKKIPGSGCQILFSDIGLPDGTGWDLLQQLPSPHTLFAVAMSGFGMNADRAKSLQIGFRNHLIKPITPDQFDEMLAQYEAESGSKE
jgi:CheY-like chemotaxis protein